MAIELKSNTGVCATLDALLRYNSESGGLVWLERPRELFPAERHWKRWNTKFAGRPAFTALAAGYLQGRIFNRSYFAHRVAWALVYGEWPSGDVDHINGTRDDNRLVNLRAVPHVDNCRNQKQRSTNTSGVNGVNWDARCHKWRADITIDGVSRNLGRFTNKSDAIAARKNADREHGFHKNHGLIADYRAAGGSFVETLA